MKLAILILLFVNFAQGESVDRCLEDLNRLCRPYQNAEAMVRCASLNMDQVQSSCRKLLSLALETYFHRSYLGQMECLSEPLKKCLVKPREQEADCFLSIKLSSSPCRDELAKFQKHIRKNNKNKELLEFRNRMSRNQ